MFYNNVANWSYVMSYLQRIKNSKANDLIAFYKLQLRKLQQKASENNTSAYNPSIDEFKKYVSQLKLNSVSDEKFTAIKKGNLLDIKA